MKHKRPTQEKVSQFSEENNLPKETASKILDVLYKKGKDAKSLDRLLWKMEMFLKKNAIPDLMNKMSAAQIWLIVDDMISEDNQMKAEVASNYSEKPMTVWWFSEMWSEFSDKTFEAGDQVQIQIMRTGKWQHPMYWEINITPEVLSDVKKNFDENARWIELAVDENHESNHKALGWFRELTKKWKDALFATIELTKKGAELMSEGAYKYFSPEIIFNKNDEETGQTLKNLLIGGAFTNRPFFKAMQPLLASEEAWSAMAADRHQSSGEFTVSDSNILFFNTSTSMKTILELIAQFCEKSSINAEDLAKIEAAFSEVPAEFKTAELTAAVDEIKAKFSDETGSDDQWSEDKGSEEGADKSEDKADDKGAASEDKKEDPAAEEKAGEQKTDEPASAGEEKKIEANEKGEITIQASEYESLKNLASEAGKLVRAARKNDLEKSVAGLCFSESNKTGVVLPKQTKEIVDFALSLSEKQSEKFLGILGKLQAVTAGETGASGEFSEDQKFSEENAEKINFFCEKFGFTKEQAIQAVKDAESTK